MNEYARRFTPVHKSLLEKKTLGGVDKRLAILNITLIGVLSMGMGTFYLIPLGIFNHSILKWISKKDPDVMEIYLKSQIIDDIYDPWAKVGLKNNSRPDGFGKDLLC